MPRALTSCPTSLKFSPKKNFPEKICTRKLRLKTPSENILLNPFYMSTTTITPNPLLTDSKLAESYFGGQPGFPTIRQTPTASWPTVDGAVGSSAFPLTPTRGNGSISPHPHPVPVLNKIYFNKKTLKETVKRYNPNSLQNETAQVWEIPFSVDVEIPVGDLIQRIQHVMKSRGIYKHWDINMNTFLITASQVTSEWDTIR